MIISSPSNPAIKMIHRLREKSRARRQEELFVMEDWKEVQMATRNGWELTHLFMREGTLTPVDWDPNVAPIHYVKDELFSTLVYRSGTVDVCAIARTRAHSLEELSKPLAPSCYLVLDQVEKPGNVGAILRTADAAGLTGVLIVDPVSDLYNPNVIRSSVGTIFSVPIALCNLDQALGWLSGIPLLITQLEGGKAPWDLDLRGPLAIILGTEATGVRQPWRDRAAQFVKIPMFGQNDSLNVSNTAAILAYEHVRQRNG
ncbi:MAG: hypothetical protein KDC57_05405 [Saprospiraceae bacterium]|nr:hypothetical protein [Saprospiraceae bacterium]